MIQFTWGVPSDGFQWIEARPISDRQIQSSSERFLTPGFTLQWRRYNPFQDTPALFCTFGDLQPTEDAIRAFANQYGALILDQDLALPDGKHARGERWEVWQTEIISMKHALRVWQALKARNQDVLAQWFSLNDQGGFADVVYTPDEPWPLGVPQLSAQYIGDALADQVRFLGFGHGASRGDPTDREIPPDAAGWAQAFLRVQVNSRLHAHTGASLQYLSEGEHALPLGLHIVPSNLLGALWLQFALAIEGDQLYQRCPQCQGWFQVPAKARRASTIYCSARCRVQAYRKRQAEARQ